MFSVRLFYLLKILIGFSVIKKYCYLPCNRRMLITYEKQFALTHLVTIIHFQLPFRSVLSGESSVKMKPSVCLIIFLLHIYSNESCNSIEHCDGEKCRLSSSIGLCFYYYAHKMFKFPYHFTSCTLHLCRLTNT